MAKRFPDLIIAFHLLLRTTTGQLLHVLSQLSLLAKLGKLLQQSLASLTLGLIKFLQGTDDLLANLIETL